MKPKTTTQDTYLPLFQGYYHTIFDESDRYVDMETEMDDSELKEHYSEVFDAGVTIDYFKENFSYHLNYAKGYEGSNEYITDALIELNHSDIILEVKYQKMVSPKYYNFSNDSINVSIKYDHQKLKKFISDNLNDFETYISGKYTSRDGFISSYSNDSNEWLESINSEDIGEHELGSLLEFVFQVNYGSDNEGAYALHEESNCSEGFMNSVEFDHKAMIKDYKTEQAKAGA